ncbi:PREDICTED: yjeF N-terminal domain-containing protein 3 [Chaetura pelagica]|uniref:yjeF N-terminal domain-containing protein 3 n=1 Tax=Chaetura pelagica TaxID=8897 RepID=UPI00052366DE|nr:PREDICTED: yjeF N-terminal domain-containing protein 3 [Chaetura pelagica]
MVWQVYGKEEAEAMEKELLEDYRFGRQQLIEIWGHACAMAVTKHPWVQHLTQLGRPGLSTLLVGLSTLLVGLSTLLVGLSTLLVGLSTLLVGLSTLLVGLSQAEHPRTPSSGISHSTSVPSTVPFRHVPGSPTVLGQDQDQPRWDVEAGGSGGGISPEVLVSLSAPKQCARRFLGRQHFLAGRFLPYDLQKKFELNPPQYPGTECVVALPAPRE